MEDSLIAYCYRYSHHDDDKALCKECMEGFSPNEEHTECIDCHKVTPGCKSCENRKICNECADGLKLVEGECVSSDVNCYKWTFTSRTDT